MKIKLGVLFGGRSVEHEVSIITAMQAIAAIDRQKYSVVPIYITKQNEFYTSPHLENIEVFKDITSLKAKSKRVTLVRDGGIVKLVPYPATMFSTKPLGEIEVACPFVHGTFVEDGTLSGLLELLEIPYIGADVLAGAVGMNKYVMKCVLEQNNIPVLPCLTFRSKQFFDDKKTCFNAASEKIGFPVIIKPVNLGSSVGIGIARDENEFTSRMQTALSFADIVLVERAVTALKEINCSALGDSDEIITSVCEQPVNSDEILSYKDKYLSSSKSKGIESAKRRIPAPISKDVEANIRRLTKETFAALNCSGVARVDFIIDESDNSIFVNEINTLPGSLAFYLWEATGLPYTQLLDKLVKIALKRHRERQRLNFSFDTNILSATSFGGKK